MENNSFGLLVILGIIAVILLGGVKNAPFTPPLKSSTTQTQSTANIEQQIKKAQSQVKDLEKEIQLEADKKTQSQYKDIVTLSFISKSSDPSREYATIKVSTKATSTIQVTGWTIKSLSTGNQVTIPKATYLFFTGMLNTEDNILLVGGDTLYLVTGISPNGASFKVNKCSGYLGQFQTFVPYLNNSCPLPKNENLSSIPNLVVNDACFDYIDSMPRCRIQTKPLPPNFSSECTNFIYNKINYPSCINTHKDDKDFYQKEWRVYLERSARLWKDKHESIVLYDSGGKIVDTLTY